MILIADDTFEKEKYSFLEEEKYKKVCKIYTIIKTTDLALIFQEIEASVLFCYHKSLQLFTPNFEILDNETNHKLRENLITKTTEKVEFSGGENDNNLTLRRTPKENFYKNLKPFLDDYIANQNVNLEILFYGKPTDNQQEKTIETSFFQQKNFVFSLKEADLENYLCLKNYEDFQDETLHKIILENLDNEDFNAIFIPLNFLGFDLNGLRLAMHIRFTPTKNQRSTIFIYGTPNVMQFVDNQYFDILKTKNVFYIDYNKKSLQEAENKQVASFPENELSEEISKIKLSAPKDNHSIANEWAIYRWAKSIHADDEAISKINQKIENNLYYKYLQTIFPVSVHKDLQDLKIRFANEKPKVLYIDDEYEKGWNEIFATLLYDEGIDFESLETDFSKSQEEIISEAVEKIKEKDIDTVILDFRLHKSDFQKDTKIENITSVKLLQEIKKINAGIQVIFFSATNKIWNLQKLQELGADGFIIKESPENSVNTDFTSETILQFKNTMETAFKKRFLKKLFLICDEIQQNIEKEIGHFSEEFDKFLKELNTQLKIIKIGLKNIDLKNKMSLDVVFLGGYNFMEKFKGFYFYKEDYRYYIGEENTDAKNYYFDKNNNFVEEENIENLTWFSAMANLFIDYFNICEKDDEIIKNLEKVKEKRNKYIHENKPYFDEKELLLILSLCREITENLKD